MGLPQRPERKSPGTCRTDVSGLAPEERPYILGVQANLWTEYIFTSTHLKHMLLPRLAAIAEVGWAYDRKDFADFKRRMNSFRKCYDAAGYNYATYFFDGKDE